LDSAALRSLTPQLALLAGEVDAPSRYDPGVDDVERIDQIAALERLKRAAAAAQARVTAAFAASQRAVQQAAGVRAERLGRGVADQVALARRESPSRGGRLLGLATALTTEMPHTLAALTRGDIGEWAATVLVRETAVLSADDRRQVDDRLHETLSTSGVGERALTRVARGIAHELDPAAAAARASKAAKDRRVSIRPAPDTMTWLTGHLPVADGVAVFAALDAAAKSAAAAGDTRTRGQVMADTLIERVTGRAITDAVPVSVQLVMTDTTLLGGGHAPASVPGHGPVPAPVARALVAAAADRGAAWVRRLFTTPDRARLVAIESRHRLFPKGLRELITLQDQTCATPWCDAPIRHIDHIKPHHRGGRTALGNGQGLCEHCNLVKETAGWSTARTDSGQSVVATPTGHTYESTPPPPLGYPPSAGEPPRRRLDVASPRAASCIEIAMRQHAA
jgi:hypothetical protein